MYTWYMIIVEALYVDESDVDGFQGLKTIYAYVHHIDDNINLMWNRLSAYFPAAGDLYNGWQSFFTLCQKIINRSLTLLLTRLNLIPPLAL